MAFLPRGVRQQVELEEIDQRLGLGSRAALGDGVGKIGEPPELLLMVIGTASSTLLSG